MKQNAFHAAIFAWPCVLLDRSPLLWRLSIGEGRMPLHDAFGINCKRGATAENQDAGVKYMGEGVYV